MWLRNFTELTGKSKKQKKNHTHTHTLNILRHNNNIIYTWTRIHTLGGRTERFAYIYRALQYGRVAASGVFLYELITGVALYVESYCFCPLAFAYIIIDSVCIVYIMFYCYYIYIIYIQSYNSRTAPYVYVHVRVCACVKEWRVFENFDDLYTPATTRTTTSRSAGRSDRRSHAIKNRKGIIHVRGGAPL